MGGGGEVKDIEEQIQCAEDCWGTHDGNLIRGLLEDAYRAGLLKAANMATGRAGSGEPAPRALLRLGRDLRKMSKGEE